MRVLVLGCGSIGRRHLANLGKLGAQVLAYDPDPSRAEWVRRRLGARTVPSLEAGFASGPDAVWICVPPALHARLALQALALRLPCFIEKPLAHTLEDGRAILKAARRAKVPVCVGYQLRWDPDILELRRRVLRGSWGRLHFIRAQVGQHLPDWRPWQDYRRSYTARRELGGGILLDASHEIDLALFLAGDADAVYCQAHKLGGFQLDVEDTASLTLSHRRGSVSEIHLDMVSRAPRRSIELSFARATVVLDWMASTVRVYSASTRRWASTRLAAHYSEHYVREAAGFLAAVRRPSRVGGLVTVEEGLRTLAVIAAAKRSGVSRRRERVR